MKYRKLGTTDIDVSVICLGTMTFGEQNTQEEGFEQLDYAVDRGINFIDTAELYAIMPRKETYGKTEEIIGNWFSKRNSRNKIILASKIASKDSGLSWIREGGPKLKFDKKKVGYKHAFLIGLAQAFAILPGISRSGSTIVMALFLGISKKESSKFSFLMVIPLIFGALLKNVFESEDPIRMDVNPPLIIGFTSAFITGIIACKWMVKLVNKSKLKFFGIYCLIAGGISLLYEVT